MVLAVMSAVGCGTDSVPLETPDVGAPQEDASSQQDAGANGAPGEADAAQPLPDVESPDAGFEELDGSNDEDDVFDPTDTGDAGTEDTGTEDTGGTDAGSGIEGDTCETATDVTAGGVWEDQTTTGFTDDYSAAPGDANCPNNRLSGADRAYFVAPLETTEYRVVVTPRGQSFDPAIYVRANCAEAACVTGTVLNGAGAQESVRFTANAGQTLFIIVDGEMFSSGDYTLTVEIL
jgi:hypothetical protein